MKTRSVIITAGGVGKRMGAQIPKQFLNICGKPILMHTIEKFQAYDPEIEIIVVLPQREISTWNDLCKQYHFQVNHAVVEGGKERFHSVKNGLQKTSGSWIGVHDAVRPLVTVEVIRNCFETVIEKQAVIPVVQLKESLRQLTDLGSVAVDRSAYRSVQTPQCFEADMLKKAYESGFDSRFTDDASVVEANGVTITTVEGNDENIKITTPTDLRLAELLLNNE